MTLICVRVFWSCVFFVNYVVKLSESVKALYKVLVTVTVGITLEKNEMHTEDKISYISLLFEHVHVFG